MCLLTVKLPVFYCHCLILWMFILRLLVEMGQFGNDSLINLRRGFHFGYWAFLCMMFPYIRNAQGRFSHQMDSVLDAVNQSVMGNGQVEKQTKKKPKHFSDAKELQGRGCLISEELQKGPVPSWWLEFACFSALRRLSINFFNWIILTTMVDDVFPKRCAFAWEQASSLSRRK